MTYVLILTLIVEWSTNGCPLDAIYLIIFVMVFIIIVIIINIVVIIIIIIIIIAH